MASQAFHRGQYQGCYTQPPPERLHYPGLLQGQRGDHLAQSVHRNHVGVCAADVPKLYGRGARNTGEPYRQGTDSRSHPQGRKGPYRRGQDHLLRADDVLH